MKPWISLALVACASTHHPSSKFPPDGAIAASRWNPAAPPSTWGKTVRARFFGYRSTLAVFDDLGHVGIERHDGTIAPVPFTEPVQDAEVILKGDFPDIVDRVCATLRSGALECILSPRQYGRWEGLGDVLLWHGWICLERGCFELRHDGHNGYLVPTSVLRPRLAASELGAARRTYDALVLAWRKALPDAGDAIHVDATAGATRVCAVRANGTVQCHGSSLHGELGDGEAVATPRTGTAKLEQAVEVAVADTTTCARTIDGRVACWGTQWDGDDRFPVPPDARMQEELPACGDDAWSCDESGRRRFLTRPTFVPGITDAVSIAASATRICVVRKDGELTCWGPR